MTREKEERERELERKEEEKEQRERERDLDFVEMNYRVFMLFVNNLAGVVCLEKKLSSGDRSI